jgi:phosphoribosylglycinamide formyltransferase 1
LTVPRVTALISGTGSNLQALIDARRSGRLPVEIGHVISNRADAAGLQRAAEAGIRCSVLEPGGFSSRESYDTALAEHIEAGEPHLIVLVGFMRILGDTLVNRFHGRLINLHPSLLPLYRGTNTYVRALQAGDREHGASMHFVTAELDGGPVVSQVRIPILPNDDASRLAARLSPREHQLVVATVELFARHVVECRDDSVYVDRLLLNRPLQLEADGSLAP